MTDTVLGFASIAVLGTSVVFWIRAFSRVAIPENRGFYVAAWATAAMLGVASLIGDPGWLGGVPAAVGTFASLFFLATVAIGGQKVGEGVIQVGHTIPAFTAIDEHGGPFDS